MAEWFRRKSAKIKTTDKLEIAEGMWLKCPQCQEVLYRTMLEDSQYVCTNCTHHFRIGTDDYIKLIIDNEEYEEIAKNVQSVDPLNFQATKKYIDQINDAQIKTGSKDALKTLIGRIHNTETVLAIMDFSFIGGSMGSVVGEKISRSIDRAEEKNLPLIIITASGGARMQEGAYSLMQLAKVSTKLAHYSKQGGFYIVVLTDPTTGGTTASFAMLGDIAINKDWDLEKAEKQRAYSVHPAHGRRTCELEVRGYSCGWRRLGIVGPRGFQYFRNYAESLLRTACCPDSPGADRTGVPAHFGVT